MFQHQIFPNIKQNKWIQMIVNVKQRKLLQGLFKQTWNWLKFSLMPSDRLQQSIKAIIQNSNCIRFLLALSPGKCRTGQEEISQQKKLHTLIKEDLQSNRLVSRRIKINTNYQFFTWTLTKCFYSLFFWGEYIVHYVHSLSRTLVLH